MRSVSQPAPRPTVVVTFNRPDGWSLVSVSRVLMFSSNEAAHGAGQGLGITILSEARMLPRHNDFGREREVVAHRHAGSGTEADWETLVQTIPQADGEVDAEGERGLQVDGGEEASALAAEGQALAGGVEAGGAQGLLDGGQDGEVADGEPGAWTAGSARRTVRRAKRCARRSW